jgi:hypothetical protein
MISLFGDYAVAETCLTLKLSMVGMNTVLASLLLQY